MKIYSWNVNGIRAVHKKGFFAPFIEKHQPDVLCLQETKAEQGQSEVDLPEYDEYWCSAEKKGYSGTAIFTKIAPEAEYYGLPEDIKKAFDLKDSYGDTAKEGRVTTLEFEHFFVTSVYTPNAKDDLSRLPARKQWDAAFLTYMKQLQSEKPVIFCGDLNVAHTELDLARPKENKGKKGFTEEERHGIDNMLAAGFVDSFRLFHQDNGHYTWWSHFAQARERNVGWRIDYVMADENLRSFIKKAAIHPDVSGSDHCPVSIEIAL
ncbi:exodeoxyribonuclease III [Candidatus Kaiserbacteria bacterium RIFOXYB1_FULL_46_14]|uniref:Exodeoxyribonuclease III n=1 Tax=Candidatus Kaiserbacteria bacterium RIFOXYB1_FULL_46_14 TaxID=1798531 RepID=A0A1F6FI74_9BACT|nr:MAG: exodeoxyribonuclease III [Candidatus Kaiserbacteria bacterium RIFOXYB1_FULL_46_14]